MSKYTNIPFVKYSATGNDFILIDNRSLGLTSEDADFFKRICQRRTSAGADGVLLIEESSKHDFQLRYFNADGSETECGNGARSAAHFVFSHGLAGSKMSFVFGEAVYEAEVDGSWVKLKMPSPRDLQETLGIVKENGFDEGGFIHIGVPHFVLFGKMIAELDLQKWGPEYRQHAAFQPAGANINFVEVLGENKLKVRTYERGVENETLSCGTGCVASAYLAHLKQKTRYPTEIMTKGGNLKVSKNPHDEHLYLEGEVKAVYEAKFYQ